MSEQLPPSLSTAGSVPPDPDRSTPLERSAPARAAGGRGPLGGGAARSVGLVLVLLLVCVVGVVTGSVVLVYPGASIVVLTSVLGIVLIVEGACLIATGFTMRHGQSGVVPAAAPGPQPAIPRPAVPPAARL